MQNYPAVRLDVALAYFIVAELKILEANTKDISNSP